MATETEIRKPGTPPAWVNALMKGALRTPGLRGLLGRGLAVITVTGAKTGRHYSTPVQYLTHGADFVVLSQRRRTWWRNIEREPGVRFLVRGRDLRARAAIADDDQAHRVLAELLPENPRVAKWYKVELDDTGRVDPEAIDLLLDNSVVLVITPDADAGSPA